MKVQASKNPDGSLTIKQIDVMAPLKKGEKGLKFNIDLDWMRKAESTFKMLKRAGVGTYSFRGHNHKDKPAPQISKPWGDLFVDEKRQRLVAKDVVVNDPESVEMLLNGKLPRRSAEFYPEPPFIAGLALMEAGEIGHQNFSGALPDIAVELLSLSNPTDTVTSELDQRLELELEEEHMPLNEEDVSMIKTMIRDAIKEALDEGGENSEPDEEAVAEALKKHLPEAIKLMKANDPEALAPDSQSMIDKALKKHKLELDKVKAEADIDSKIQILLHNEGNVYTEKQLRSMFEDEKTLLKYGNRAGLYEYLKLQNEAGKVKLEAELDGPITLNAEKSLSDEYDRLWPDEETAPVTRKEYIRLNKETWQATHA